MKGDDVTVETRIWRGYLCNRCKDRVDEKTDYCFAPNCTDAKCSRVDEKDHWHVMDAAFYCKKCVCPIHEIKLNPVGICGDCYDAVAKMSREDMG